MKELNLKSRIVFGKESLAYLKDIKSNSALVITDKSMVEVGAVSKVTENLLTPKVTVFDEVLPNPTISIVTKGVKILEEAKADSIIGIGGGSVLDSAKAIRKIYAEISGGHTGDIKLIAIPTTSGTGSEVTSYAVISDDEKGIKYAFEGEELIPDIAILNPGLTMSMPPSVTADTGMDALTHAMEAYVSTDANDFSDSLSERAIRIIYKYLPLAVEDGNNETAREKLCNASCLAGIAFSAVGLGVNHGLAHAIGEKLHISHGRINAMLLPHIIRLNSKADGEEDINVENKIKRITEIIGLSTGSGSNSANILANAISRLNKKIGIPATLTELGKKTEEVMHYRDEIIELALKDITTKTNPKKVTPEQLSGVITALMGKNHFIK